MKTKKPYLVVAIVLGLAAVITQSMQAALPAPLPERMSIEQLQKRKVKQDAASTKAQASAETGHFFTGKPYQADTNTYPFLYRSYHSELNRWIVQDPSGFPDGANNVAYVASPCSEIDYQGLLSVTVTLSGYTFELQANGAKIDKEDIGPQWTASGTNLSVTYNISGTLEISSSALPGGSASIEVSTSATAEVPDGKTAHLDGWAKLNTNLTIEYGFKIRVLE
jgi:RHS repeat-associated protein